MANRLQGNLFFINLKISETFSCKITNKQTLFVTSGANKMQFLETRILYLVIYTIFIMCSGMSSFVCGRANTRIMIKARLRLITGILMCMSKRSLNLCHVYTTGNQLQLKMLRVALRQEAGNSRSTSGDKKHILALI